MKSLRNALLLIAVFGSIAGAFESGRLSVLSNASLQQTAAATPYVESQPIEMIEVLVAKTDLPVGTYLKNDEFAASLGTLKLPKNYLPENVIRNAAELRNKYLTRTIRRGNYFSPEDVEDGGIKIPDGMYQYGLKCESCCECIGAGDKVNIIFTQTLADGTPKSSVVFWNMLVLAVDTPSYRREPAFPNPNLRHVSIAVTAEQGLALSSYEKRGDVKLLVIERKIREK